MAAHDWDGLFFCKRCGVAMQDDIEAGGIECDPRVFRLEALLARKKFKELMRGFGSDHD